MMADKPELVMMKTKTMTMMQLVVVVGTKQSLSLGQPIQRVFSTNRK